MQKGARSRAPIPSREVILSATVPARTPALDIDATALAAANRASMAAIWEIDLPGSANDSGDVRLDARRGAYLSLADGRVLPVHGIDARAEADAWLSQVVPGRELPEVIGVIGAGLGWIVDAIEARSRTTRVLVLEPEPVLAAAMLGRRDWRELIGAHRLLVLTGPAYGGHRAAWRILAPAATNPPLLVHPVIGLARREATTAAARVFGGALAGARANEAALQRLRRPILLNTLANLDRVAASDDVAKLFGVFSGIPAVVLGAGPSLDRNLAALSAVRGRALVIAVDTALRPCLLAGVEPHLVVSLDPSPANADHLLRLPRGSRTRLVVDPAVQPGVLAGFEGRTVTFRVAGHHPWPWLTAHGVERAQLRVWGSVLTAAFDLAMQAGCSPIVFAGADLAFSGGRPYCRNTVAEARWAERVRGGHTLDETFSQAIQAYEGTVTGPSLDGTRTVTTGVLLSFRQWILDRAREARGTRVLNVSGTGILHGDGIEQCASLPDWPSLGGAIERMLDSCLARQGRRSVELRRALRHPGTWPSEWTSIAPTADIRAALRHHEPPPSEVALNALHRLPERTAIIESVHAATAFPEWVRAMEWPPLDGERLAGAWRALAAGDLLSEPAVIVEEAICRLAAAASPPASPPAHFWMQHAVISADDHAAARADDASIAPATMILAAVGSRPEADRVRAIVRILGQAAARESGWRVRAEAKWLESTPTRIEWSVPESALGVALTGVVVEPDRRQGAHTLWSVETGLREQAEPQGPRLRLSVEAPAGRAVAAIAPTVMNMALGGAVSGVAPFDADHAVVSMVATGESYVVDAAGGIEHRFTWPRPVAGDLAYEAGQGRVAWTRGHETAVVMLERSGSIREWPLPCDASGALVRSDGGVLFSGAAGLWHWHPDRGATRLREGTFLGAHADGGGIRVDALDQHDGQPVRPRGGVRYASPDLVRFELEPLDPLGPRWGSAMWQGWLAESFPHADIIRLSSPLGSEYHLRCYFPSAVTWMDGSLLVLTATKDLLLFPAVSAVCSRHAA